MRHDTTSRGTQNMKFPLATQQRIGLDMYGIWVNHTEAPDMPFLDLKSSDCDGPNVLYNLEA